MEPKKEEFVCTCNGRTVKLDLYHSVAAELQIKPGSEVSPQTVSQAQILNFYVSQEVGRRSFQEANNNQK